MSEAMEVLEPEVPEIEVFEPPEVYHGEGFLGCDRELGEDWFQSIYRYGVILETHLERKIFWSSRNHQVRTSIERRQRRFGTLELGGNCAGSEHGKVEL